MDAREAIDHLATIRRIMESATRLTVLPGKAAIAGGTLALAGAAATYVMTGSLGFEVVARMAGTQRACLIALWVLVAALGVGLNVAMTVRLARKKGLSPWSRLCQLAAYAMAPGILIALALTVALGLRNEWQNVPAIWMMMYGAAVWMASVLSARAPGVLGLVFIAAGVVTLFWAAQVALVMIALTFGLAHVVYGIYLIRAYGD